MQAHGPDTALKMRALAAQLRAHAAETSMDHFRRKFEVAASELEENALDIESRVWFREKLKLVS